MTGSIHFGFLVLILASIWRNASCKPMVPALYIFGDSTVDPGNNDRIVTIAKANFPPYGQDFPGGVATGRFSNGKLVTDFLSGALGLPDLLPAYLDPNFRGQKLLTGCSFASAGAGIDDSTSNALGTIPLGKQLENFKSYRSKLQGMIGKGAASRIITEALFGISMGTNDFLQNYYTNPATRAKYTIEQFQDVLLQHLQLFIENIYKEGSTKFLIFGLPPFGCCPSQITSHNLFKHTCVQEFNDVATSHNMKLQALIESMKSTLPGLQIVYIDIYNKVHDVIENPRKYGFEETRKGCCGTGLFDVFEFCNELSKVCADSSKYVFWDSIHPTLAMYSITAEDIRQQVTRLIKF